MTIATVTLKTGKSVKLGRIRPTDIIEDAKYRVLVFPGGKTKATLKLGKYYSAANDKSPPPASVDWSTKAMAAIQRIYLNDTYGDCVIAGKYHQVGVWSANDDTQGQQQPVMGTDQEVLNSYHTICGPGDNGCDIPTVLDYFKANGLLFNGVAHKIDGYVSIDWTNKLMVQVALEVFGGLTIGINLPGDWTCTNCTWDVTNSGIVGGHDICCVGYNATGVICATWGGLVTITWAAFLQKTWIEECYAELAPDWYGSDKLATNGIDAATLASDLQQIGGGVIPDPGPGPTPPVPPVPVPPIPPVPVPPPVQMVNIPAQIATIFGMPLVHIAPLSVPVTQGMHAAIVIPPWLLPAIRALCGYAPVLPAPWNALAALVCGFLPPGTHTPCGGCK